MAHTEGNSQKKVGYFWATFFWEGYKATSCFVASGSLKVAYFFFGEKASLGELVDLYTQRRWVLRHAQRRYLYTRPPPPNDLIHLQAK